MVRKCVIDGCGSRSGDPQHRGVTFHSFPFDSKTRAIWIANCRLAPGKNITKSILVCSRHFRRADFQPMKSNKFLLKQGSVPTVFPWGKVEQVESDETNLQTEKYWKGGDDTPLEMNNIKQEAPPVLQQSTKRPHPDADTEAGSSAKMPKLTPCFNGKSTSGGSALAAALQSDTRHTTGTVNRGNVMNPSGTRKMEPLLGFTPGVKIEAQDFDGIWHTARVVEVDNDEREVLIRFEKSSKNKGASGIEEWIPMNSSRLRQKAMRITSRSAYSFVLGEKCFARWSGSRRFPATISKVLPNDTYEVLFDDGYIKVVKGAHISKIKHMKNKSESSRKLSLNSSSSTKSRSGGKKDWPLISISSLNLEELNLPDIPKDGEWCCYWVNDQPIGEEGFLNVGDHRKPTVIVHDWRLPPNWTKHMYQRSNVLGKWDVILVNPQGKRFRSKSDLKQFVESQGQVYNPDIYDFSIHRRRAKDIGCYVYTKDYKPPATQKQTFPTSLTTARIPTPVPVLIPQVQSPIPSSTPETESPSKVLEEEISSLEDGYVHVGALKVQIVDNLFRCPQEGCNKHFRKENHLQIHIKHYHGEIAKLLGVCPNMQDLACKRTIGLPTEEPLPKNHFPNVQFFAKLHEQDMQSRVHRKSTSHHITASGESPSSPTPIVVTGSPTSPTVSAVSALSTVDLSNTAIKIESETSSKDGQEVELQSTNTSQSLSPAQATSFPTTAETTSPSRPVAQILAHIEHPTGDDSPLTDEQFKAVTPSKQKTISESSSSRKSSRQRLTKKYLTSISPGVFESTFGATDFEETRHSFNATPEHKSMLRKPKHTFVSLITGSDSNQDANSQTTGSFPENSQSPQYINENGEVIKIVRMKQEEIINCLCSYGEEDGLMIQCELCLCWQHGVCNGIEKESQVPEKYVCYICRNPQRGRSSLKYIHDQDWLYEGKLPVAKYHGQVPGLDERFEILRRTHTLTGNLLEFKRFLHSLRVKINIAGNKDHPKMYLWAKKWESSNVDYHDESKECEEKNGSESSDVKCEIVDANSGNCASVKLEQELEGSEDKLGNSDNTSDVKPQLDDNGNINYNKPTIPQPEAPIDPTECQRTLLEHIQKQQSCAMDRLQAIESQIMEIESLENTSDLDIDDCSKARAALSMLIRDLEIMKTIAKINTVQPTFVTY